jgi:hypothetical protein
MSSDMRIIIKSTKKTISAFLATISDLIEHEKHLIDGPAPPWIAIWTKWEKEGILNFDNRLQLTKLLFPQSKTSTGKTTVQPINDIIDIIQTNVPILDIHYDFNISTKNNDTYIMTPKDKTSQKPSGTTTTPASYAAAFVPTDPTSPSKSPPTFTDSMTVQQKSPVELHKDNEDLSYGSLKNSSLQPSKDSTDINETDQSINSQDIEHVKNLFVHQIIQLIIVILF